MKKMLEREHKCTVTLIEDDELDQDEYMFEDSRIITEKSKESLADE